MRTQVPHGCRLQPSPGGLDIALVPENLLCGAQLRVQGACSPGFNIANSFKAIATMLQLDPKPVPGLAGIRRSVDPTRHAPPAAPDTAQHRHGVDARREPETCQGRGSQRRVQGRLQRCRPQAPLQLSNRENPFLPQGLVERLPSQRCHGGQYIEVADVAEQVGRLLEGATVPVGWTGSEQRLERPEQRPQPPCGDPCLVHVPRLRAPDAREPARKLGLRHAQGLGQSCRAVRLSGHA